MDVRASLRHLRQSPTKVRLVVDVIRGMSAVEAEQRLHFIRKRASLPVRKLLLSAMANAENNFKLERADLFVKEARVDEGPTLKRWQPKAYGSAGQIRKRSCHVILVLEDRKAVEKKPAVKKS